MEKVTNKEQAESLFYGEKKELLLPSRFSVTIREQNGNDDEILSNKSLAKDLSNLDMFISSLVLKTDLPFAKAGKLSSTDVGNMLLRDKYFIVFASRVHSIGPEVKFDFDWGKENGGVKSYVDNIESYLWDYNEPFPEEGDENYNPYRIEPYGEEPYGTKEIVLTSSKKLRFHLLNGKSEKILLKEPMEKQSRLSEIKARNLEQETNGKWEKVDNFSFFTKKDMTELNFIINTMDAPFAGLTEIENPKNGEVIYYPIIKAENFLYPEEI